MTDRSQRQGWLFWFGLGLSLAVHVGGAAYLLSRTSKDFGAIDRPTTAISVNIEATDILDAAEQSAATEATQAPASPPGELVPVSEAEAEQTEPARTEPEQADPPPPPVEPEKKEAETPPPPTAEQQAAVEEARIRDEEALRRTQEAEREKRESERKKQEVEREKQEAERERQQAERKKQEAEREEQEAEQRARDKARQLAEERAHAEREDEAREAERKRRAEKAKQAEREAKEKRSQAASNAGASGSTGAKASRGRISASQGALQNYAGIVNAWIARNKPSRPSGARGTVVILLTLSPSGTLTSARVSSSSGNPTFDQIALGAVRRSSPFPKPPPGSTTNQLRFTFPYHFQ